MTYTIESSHTNAPSARAAQMGLNHDVARLTLSNAALVPAHAIEREVVHSALSREPDYLCVCMKAE